MEVRLRHTEYASLTLIGQVVLADQASMTDQFLRSILQPADNVYDKAGVLGSIRGSADFLRYWYLYISVTRSITPTCM